MLTTSELTILGLVIEQPQHGYDLEQVIERRGIRQWTDIAFSSIYYLLTKMEKRGLIQASEQATGPKSRRIFRATSEGRATAATAALAAIQEPKPVEHPILVALSNLPLLSEEEYAAAIRARLTRIDARLDAIRSTQQAQQPLPLPAQEVFSFSLSLLEAERSWLAMRTPKVPDDGQD